MKKRMIDKEIIKDIACGMSRSELTQKYSLSGNQLRSIFKQLSKIRASRIQALVGDLKSGMARSDIMTKYQLSVEGLETALKRLLNSNAISPAEFETFSTFLIKGRMNDTALMEKYGLSVKGLQYVFKKLMDFGRLKQDELQKRTAETEKTGDVAWKCSHCGAVQPKSFEQCPCCDVIGSRIQSPQSLEQAEEIGGSETQGDRHLSGRKVFQEALGRIHNTMPLFLSEFKTILRKPYVAAIAGATIMIVTMVIFLAVQRRADESSQSKAVAPHHSKEEKAKNSGVHRPEKNSQGALGEELVHHAKTGNTKLIPPLLQKGANINARSEKYRTTPLMMAAFGGHVDTVKLLLEKGADVNAKDEVVGTALFLASNAGHLEVVELLLEKGADVNAKNKNGGTALTDASCSGRLEVVKLLLEKGADVNAKDEVVGTALMMAAFGGHVDTVKLLLANGADVNAKDQLSLTALMMASDKGHVDIVKILLAKGADINAKNEHGETALMLASNKGHQQVVNWLEMYGAK